MRGRSRTTVGRVGVGVRIVGFESRVVEFGWKLEGECDAYRV